MSAFVVPITKDGRLSAKEFIGNRTKMSNDQSSYAEAVKHLGLVRGIEGSKATHKRIKAHYNALGQQIPVPPEIREEDLKPQSEQGPGLLGKIGLRPMIETPLGVADRLNAKFAKAFKVVAEKASESDSQRGAAVRARMALADTQKQLQALQEPFKGYPRSRWLKFSSRRWRYSRTISGGSRSRFWLASWRPRSGGRWPLSKGRSRVGVLGVKPCPAPLQLRSGPFAGLAHVLPQGRDLLGGEFTVSH
ncbi:plasmid recombination protein [Klebsiella michiganensis]|uniref:plasmid recombination protein n=1 Tax=Klebsiella michiganensis TaxID=1134687 RepID=UPI002265C7B4